MITEWQMYLLVMLDNIKEFLLVLGIVTGVIAGLTLLIVLVSGGEGDMSKETAKKLLKLCAWTMLPIVILIFGLRSVVPSTRQMAVIVVTPKIANSVSDNKELQKLPDNIVNLANSWIDELKPKQEQE